MTPWVAAIGRESSPWVEAGTVRAGGTRRRPGPVSLPPPVPCREIPGQKGRHSEDQGQFLCHLSLAGRYLDRKGDTLNARASFSLCQLPLAGRYLDRKVDTLNTRASFSATSSLPGDTWTERETRRRTGPVPVSSPLPVQKERHAEDQGQFFCQTLHGECQGQFSASSLLPLETWTARTRLCVCAHTSLACRAKPGQK